jgi:hypothetical protein
MDGAAMAWSKKPSNVWYVLRFSSHGRALDAAVKTRQAVKPDLKVLFTTGYTRNAIVHNGVLDSGTQLLPKPFSIDDLAAKLRSMLDQY